MNQAPNPELAKTYDPSLIEDRWYAQWESKDLFKPSIYNEETFSLVIPPPNVTGILHMGHALVQTLQDIFVRYNRMLGKSTLWIPGTDHAGIATQNVVERQLSKEGQSRHKLGREAFVKEVWKWKEKYHETIVSQIKKLGGSCDWSRERFTLDEGLSDAVRMVFIKLYEEGLIYRGKRIVNWSPKLETAVSDVEVEYKDETGSLWYLKYPLAESGNGGSRPAVTYLVVATTRPETMLGDTAVAVNPKDERYKHLIGKKILLPIVNREIPIIADDLVDKDFGTGCVKVTPAHDANDFEMGQRHHLPLIVIMDTKARMNENCPKDYQGLTREKAREKVVETFTASGLLEKIEDYQHSVGYCQRSQVVIEPYLSSQWFVKMKPLAKPAIEAVKNKKITLYPARWEKIYLDWMENIRDWCISRQLWWGHRIPVWYVLQNSNEKILETTPFIVANDEKEALVKAQIEYGKEIFLKQDEDVLDTWFSSALWPFSTMGWPQATPDLKKFYPTTTLVTGYDILTFWVSRMIVMGIHFMKEVPFKTVFLHGLVRTADGKKMSKSSGTAIDPLEIIKEYGTDALRFTLTSLVTSGGQDIKLSVDKIKGSRNFMNKLWNVTRFVLMQDDSTGVSFKPTPVTDAHHLWIVSRYHSTLQQVADLYNDMRFGEAANLIYEFTWNEFCDWYIEMSKQGGNTEILKNVLAGILQMLHPIAPFITEELWHLLGHQDMIMVSQFPKADLSKINPAIEKEFKLVIDLVNAIRSVRSEMNVPLGKEIDVVLVKTSAASQKIIEANKVFIVKLAKLKTLNFENKKPEPAVLKVVEGIEVYLPMAGLIDIAEERVRLGKEIENLKKEVARFEGKLSNAAFVDKAPPAVIEGERAKQKIAQEKLNTIQKQLDSLSDSLAALA